MIQDANKLTGRLSSHISDRVNHLHLNQLVQLAEPELSKCGMGGSILQLDELAPLTLMK